MEVPPGRVEQISDGGPEAIRELLAELRAMKFNGLLKTSVVRGETPAEGVLVLRGGDGVLAEHRSEVEVTGADAVLEILKDAASEKSRLEVRTYDYGHSRISIDQLQRSYPEASVPGLGDADEVLSQAIAREAAEREAYLRDLRNRENAERGLIDDEESLRQRIRELEREARQSGAREKELESLRAELEAVKQASGLLMRRLEERRGDADVELQSQRKILTMEIENGMRPHGSRISIVGRRSWPRRPRPWPSDKRPSWRRPRPWRNGGTNWSGPPSALRRSQRTSQGRTASSPPSNRRSAGNPSNSSGGSASSRPRRGSLRGSEARPPGPWKRFKNPEAA